MMGERIILKAKGAGATGYPFGKINPKPYLTSYTKMNSKYILDYM